MIYQVENLPHVIPIGIQTSDNVNRIGFDVSAWLEKWPDMSVSVWHTLPGASAAYEAESTLEGSVLYWTIRAADTANEGSGIVEILGETADKRSPSGKTATKIEGTSLVRTTDPPDPFKSWYERLLAKINASGGAANILAPSDLTWDGEQFVWTQPLMAMPRIGGTCVVTYNGVDYVCKAVGVPSGGITITLMGKLSALGLDGGNEDAPFVLGFPPDFYAETAGGYLNCMTLDGAEAVNLAVTGDEARISDVFILSGTVASDNTVTLDKTFEETFAAYKAKKAVQLRAVSGDDLTTLTAVYANTTAGKEALLFSCAFPYSDGGHLYKATFTADGMSLEVIPLT